MKLKTLLLLEKSMGYGSLTTGDNQLRPYPGSMDDIEEWNGITEHEKWFSYSESNNWDLKRSGVSVYVTEGDPKKYWIKVKTHNLRKPNDTNEGYRQRVRKHTNKVSKAWITAARRLYNNPEINEVGNSIQMSWNEAFSKALQDPKIKPFIAETGESPIKQTQKNDTSAISDPINFTPRLEENPNMKKISYSAIVLNQESHDKLIEILGNKIPSDWKVYAHHMTIKMGELPPDKKSEKGKSVNIIATELGISDRAIAVKVINGFSTNKIPHVTIAVNTAIGAKPVDSNNIVKWQLLAEPISLTGTITEIYYN